MPQELQATQHRILSRGLLRVPQLLRRGSSYNGRHRTQTVGRPTKQRANYPAFAPPLYSYSASSPRRDTGLCKRPHTKPRPWEQKAAASARVFHCIAPKGARRIGISAGHGSQLIRWRAQPRKRRTLARLLHDSNALIDNLIEKLACPLRATGSWTARRAGHRVDSVPSTPPRAHQTSL